MVMPKLLHSSVGIARGKLHCLVQDAYNSAPQMSNGRGLTFPRKVCWAPCAFTLSVTCDSQEKMTMVFERDRFVTWK